MNKMPEGSWFDMVAMAPPVEVFSLIKKFKNDPFPQKVNLCIGAYVTNEGKPHVLPVVRKVEAEIAKDTTLLHEYLPIVGREDLRKGAINLIFGYKPEHVAKCGGVQCLGGTGALRVGLDFLKSRMNFDSVLISLPTWPNHISICESLHYKHIGKYRYFDEHTKSLDLKGMLHDLKNSRPRTALIIQACGHNPTGVDPSIEQWKEIADVVKEKDIFVFFDCAYQGFVSGDVQQDVAAIRLFADMGLEMFIAQSFSKNFGLYDERIGHLTYFSKSPSSLVRIDSNMDEVARYHYSTPPNHGASIVAAVLSDDDLTSQWKRDVRSMAERTNSMRAVLYQHLVSLGAPGHWDHVIKQRGMFSFTGLSAQQVAHMLDKHHIYMLNDGRISICALTTSNVEYVAQCINETLRTVPSDDAQWGDGGEGGLTKKMGEEEG